MVICKTENTTNHAGYRVAFIFPICHDISSLGPKRLKKTYWNKPFQRAKIFQKAYLTDFIQELVDIGIKVHCVIIESGWKEIDTVEDYKKALVGFNKKFTKS